MSQKAALVTGGSRGIGAAICKELGKAGYYVYINCRNNIDTAEEVLKEIIKTGGNGRVIKFDVGFENQIERELVNITHQKLDLIVNNAGVLKEGLLYQITLTDWNNIINTNFWGAVNVFGKLRNKLINSGSAAVINIGSIAGIRPRKGQGAYAVSKSILIEWTKKQAQTETDKGLRFYTISPGPVATNMIKSSPFYNNSDILGRIPKGRFSEPEEIAELVVLLAENVDLIQNGSNIILDGGVIQA
jgi:3-oxoacyl-[acyl-carrier protein] reductase